ncbi:hypothetical protein BH23GEM3_BH23GEM3_07000 [soil metagenome]
MSPGNVLAVAGGALILAVVLWDVFITVLQHWHGAGPIGERVVRGVWRVAVRVLSNHPAARRRRLLGYVGPGFIPLLIGLWAGLIILGFGLVYFPWIATNFSPDSGAPPPTGFTDALHFSGVSFFTIGYGDIIPTTPGMRAIGIIQGGAGFALVTLAVSYFVSINMTYSRQKALAESLHALAGESADAARVIAATLVGGSDPSILASELARLREGLSNLGSGYTNFPILHYFVARTPRESLLRLLFVAHDLSSLLDTAADAERWPAGAGLGRRLGMESTARLLRHSLAETLCGGGERTRQATEAERGAVEEGRWDERFLHACETLRSANVPVRENSRDAAAAYRRARREWEPELRASAHALGEDWEAVTNGL